MSIIPQFHYSTNRYNIQFGISIISLSFLLLIISILKPFIIDFDNIGLIIVFIHSLIVTSFLYSLHIPYKSIFILGFIARLGVMFFDLYGRNLYILPNSGADTEFFYDGALLISNNLSNLKVLIQGGVYSKILGVLFYFIGPMRIVAQYINVLIGLMTVWTVSNILYELRIQKSVSYTILIIASIFPNSLIMSAILLREILPTLLVALSLLYFVKWYKYNNILYFILSIGFVGIAGMFHSGVVALGLGYMFMLLFYAHNSNRFELNFKNILIFIPIVVIVFLFTTRYGDMIFYKFRSLEEATDIYDIVKKASGGSAYLEGLEINSPSQFFLYSPLRAFYFLGSPLPMNWRGAVDIITFFIDSLFYLFVIVYVLLNWKWFYRNKSLIFVILFSIALVALVFGIGVSNSGTAMRHRQKVMPLFLVLFAIIMNEKEKVKLVHRLSSYRKFIRR